MWDKKKGILVISAIFYIFSVGFLIPYMLIVFDLSHLVYDLNEDLADDGVFFFLYIISTFVFLPFIYSTLIKKKLSFNIRDTRRKGKNPKYYASILFIIGIPIMIWLIIGIFRYYSMSEFKGGLGEFAFNGFLVILIMLMYFCIIPALVLSFKKGKKSL
ncbi:MAG: hypothetical protein ACFFAG_15885 [Promethearchaeota archaeon]